MAGFMELFNLLAIKNLKNSRWWIMIFWLSCFGVNSRVSSEEYRPSERSDYAYVNTTYKDPITGRVVSVREESARYGRNSRIDAEYGMVVHVTDKDHKHYGCKPHINKIPPDTKWIALIKRGECKFTQKIEMHAKKSNASAVVIYNTEDQKLVEMEHSVPDVVSIFIRKKEGEQIAALVDNGTKVMMSITVGRNVINNYTQINKTSVLFVSVSFIVLMIISLAWLVFYYIQRFRYAHAKERLSKRLTIAAKKAISKIPMKQLKNGDKEIGDEFDQCAVCIEQYKQSEVVRMLPCSHLFHKSCVDPWLQEHRSCPICKMDILKAYGLQVQIEGSPPEPVDPESGLVSGFDLSITTTAASSDPANMGIEVIRYQPADVELHHRDSGRGWPSKDGDIPHPPAHTPAPASLDALPPRIVQRAGSVESIKSVIDQECSEYEALMSCNDKTKSSSSRPGTK